MTPRYDAWLLSLANRDQTLVALAEMAVAVVAAYALLDQWPETVTLFGRTLPLRAWARRLYLLAGLPLFVVTLVVPLLPQ